MLSVGSQDVLLFLVRRVPPGHAISHHGRRHPHTAIVFHVLDLAAETRLRPIGPMLVNDAVRQ